MKKKTNKEPKLIFYLIRNLVLVTLVFVLFAIGIVKLLQQFKGHDNFKIKGIVFAPTLQPIKSVQLNNLKGKSIFDVNLDQLQRQLQMQHPELAQLRVMKRFPDQIFVSARKRLPFAQIKIKGKDVTLDSEGVVLSMSIPPGKDLPVILTDGFENVPVFMGGQLKGTVIQTALTVIRIFRLNKYLSSYKIAQINVRHLSQIEFYLTDTLKVIIDQNSINYKLQMLSLILSKAKLNLEEVSYIDLRFKEPITGKKVSQNKEQARN